MMSEDQVTPEVPAEVPAPEAPVMEPAVETGVKETKEVLDLALVVESVLREVLADGKIGFLEVLKILKIRSALNPAIEGLAQVPAELKDLDAAEAAELTTHVMSQLGVESGKAVQIVEASLSLVTAALKLKAAVSS